MKTALLLSFATISPALAADIRVNFNCQNQIRTGVAWDMPVDPQGNGLSTLALEEEGALFQLWTINRQSFKDYLLDQKVVGTYLPSAGIRIQTGDPYPHVHRTRADQPFTVEIDVSGLLNLTTPPEN